MPTVTLDPVVMNPVSFTTLAGLTRDQRLAQIQAAIDGTAVQLAVLAATPEIDRPFVTYSIGDQSFSWDQTKQAMVELLERLQTVKQILGGPYMLVTRMRT